MVSVSSYNSRGSEEKMEPALLKGPPRFTMEEQSPSRAGGFLP